MIYPRKDSQRRGFRVPWHEQAWVCLKLGEPLKEEVGFPLGLSLEPKGELSSGQCDWSGRVQIVLTAQEDGMASEARPCLSDSVPIPIRDTSGTRRFKNGRTSFCFPWWRFRFLGFGIAWVYQLVTRLQGICKRTAQFCSRVASKPRTHVFTHGH